MDQAEQDFEYHIVFLGGRKVGKTSLIQSVVAGNPGRMVSHMTDRSDNARATTTSASAQQE